MMVASETPGRSIVTGSLPITVPLGRESGLKITARLRSIAKNTESRLARMVSLAVRRNELTITEYSSASWSFSIRPSNSSVAQELAMAPSNRPRTGYIVNLLFIKRYFSTCKVNNNFINRCGFIVKISNYVGIGRAQLLRQIRWRVNGSENRRVIFLWLYS